jgi:Kef-type K+ transport system membrane component KefB
MLGIAAAVVAAIGIHGGSDTLEIVGVALFAGAIVIGTSVPHLWLRRLYRRIDRLAGDDDPDKHVGRDRIEL